MPTAKLQIPMAVDTAQNHLTLHKNAKTTEVIAV
jgi:hypothetical protein